MSSSRVSEVARALRGVEFFESLSADDLKKFAEAGKVMTLGPGDILFSPGDSGSRVHLILDGAIEITRAGPDSPEPVAVAYLTPGELIGDMALLTGTRRRSGARVPEMASVWTLDRDTFERITETIPSYGMLVAKIFARRLEDFIKHMRRQHQRRRELTGHLRYFDMPTVVQTLVSSNQTGILTITDGDGETFAEVLLREGEVARARRGALQGEEAFYEIFASPKEGEFHFRTVAFPDTDGISKVEITRMPMSLLMEAMRLADELAEIREACRRLRTSTRRACRPRS